MSIEVVTASERRLSELATVVNTEYRLCQSSLVDALTHALNCGEALLEAKALAGDRGWASWMRANAPDLNVATASKWLRLAIHRDEIMHSPRTLVTPSAAIRFLRESGARTERGKTGTSPLFDVDHARRLRAQGLAWSSIALIVGASGPTAVRYQLDAEYKRRRNQAHTQRSLQRRRENRMLARAERDAEVKAHGGTLAPDASPAVKTAVRKAAVHLTSTESEIVKALRAERAEAGTA